MPVGPKQSCDRKLTHDLNALLQTWTVVRDLLECGPSDLNFVVEIDNDGFGHGSVILMFDSQEALDKFSSDPQSLSAFEAAVKHAKDGSITVYEADATIHSLV